MTLWPHQARAIHLARESIRSGRRAPLLVCPTGGGKTKTSVEICLSAVSKGNRILWLTHRRELIEQTISTIRRDGAPGIGIIQAGRESDPSQPVQVASIQTLLARRDSLPQADIVVIDEAHHFLSSEWCEVAAHYSKSIRIGLTATPQRSDGTPLGDLFDDLIQVATVKELTSAGFLVPCDVVRPDLKQRSRTIAQDPVSSYRELASGSQAIVFSPSVEEAKSCAAQFMSVGISAAHVDGALANGDRDRRIAAFKAGQIRVLTNVYCLVEGFDHPAVETCILSRSCGNRSTYLQMVGRVLRAAPGKKRALLIDLVGAVHVHGLPDDDREWTLDGNGCKPSDAEPIQQCKMCGAVYRPVPVCPMCGNTSAGRWLPLNISGDKLSPVDRGMRTSDEEKREYLDWLRREQQSKGYKPGWVYHRFVGRFGHAP